MTKLIEAEWHNDGHIINIMLDADRTVVMPFCPKGGKSGDCYAEGIGCVVTYFLDMYGLDCNVGQTFIRPEMKIAWALVGNPHDVDQSQVWVIPEDDAAFKGWLAHMMGLEPGQETDSVIEEEEFSKPEEV